jgi:hypothetical protein
VRIPYLVRKARNTQSSLGGGVRQPRPILPVRIDGPSSSVLRDGVLDTGADDTIFPEWGAIAVGLDLSRADQRDIGLVGRGPIVCRYLSVQKYLYHICGHATIAGGRVATKGDLPHGRFKTLSISRPKNASHNR